MKYTIELQADGTKLAVFDNNIMTRNLKVMTDDEGREFLFMSNIYSKDRFDIFLDCIKDAYTTVLNGLGDKIELRGINGVGSMSVLRYLDEDYGETIRQQTLEKFKDAEFGYSLKLPSYDQHQKLLLVAKDSENFIELFEGGGEVDPLFFSTLEEAKKFQEEKMFVADRISSGYMNELHFGTEEGLKKHIEEHEGYDLAAYLWKYLAYQKENCKKRSYSDLKIVQFTKNVEF